VQVRDRVCKDFTRPGSASCCCTWTEHLGTICITTIQTHQNPQAQVPPLRLLSHSQYGANTRQGSSPRISMLCEGSCEKTWGTWPRPGLSAWTWVLLCLGKFLECTSGKFRARSPSLSPRECFTFHNLQQQGTHKSGALLPPLLFSSFQTNRNLSGAECNALKGTDPLGMC
jgi:hypothetical protein